MFSAYKKKLSQKIEKERWGVVVAMAAAMCNNETFSPLKNLYQGKSIAICGAGPTLNKYNPIEGVVHIALNRSLLYENVKYDYFFADDWLGINFMQDAIISYDCEKYLGYWNGNMSEREIPESFRIKAGGKKYYTDSILFPSQENNSFVLDINRMPIANALNIGLQIMQIAFFMNPSKIYLVGMDASANGHFTNKGVSEDKLKKMEQDLKSYVSIDVLKNRWLEVKRFRDVYYPETEIISINPVGLKGLFVDEYTS